MKVGDWIQIIAQSKKYNTYIRNMGYIGTIDEIGEDYIQGLCKSY